VDFSQEATRENHQLFHEKNINLNLLRGHIGLESWNNQTKIVWVPGGQVHQTNKTPTNHPLEPGTTIHWNEALNFVLDPCANLHLLKRGPAKRYISK